MQRHSPKTLLLHYASGFRKTLLSLLILLPLVALVAGISYGLAMLGQISLNPLAILKLIVICIVLYATLLPLFLSYLNYLNTFYYADAQRVGTQSGVILRKRNEYLYKDVESMTLQMSQTNLLGLCSIELVIKGQEDNTVHINNLTVESAQSVRNKYLEATSSEQLL